MWDQGWEVSRGQKATDLPANKPDGTRLQEGHDNQITSVTQWHTQLPQWDLPTVM